MKKLTISFLGRDCPGIVSAVSQILGQTGCNIIEVTQTILCGEFAAIFIVQAPENVTEESLHTQLALGLVDAKLDLSVLVRPAVEGRWEDSVVSQPFVVTVDGPDRPGLIAAMSRVFARHGVNIDSLKAVLGQDHSNHALFVFEVKASWPAKARPRACASACSTATSSKPSIVSAPSRIPSVPERGRTASASIIRNIHAF